GDAGRGHGPSARGGLARRRLGVGRLSRLGCLGGLRRLRGLCAAFLRGFGLRFALGARDGLLGIVARLALEHAGGVEKARHAVGGLGALRQPMRYALEFEMDALLRILRQYRIIGVELLVEAGVAWVV